MKKTPFPSPLTIESFMAWWMHRISEEFGERALLKGGMELALLNSPRYTNDLDYVMLKYSSKNEIEPILKSISREVPGGKTTCSKKSKNIQIAVQKDGVLVQIEASVAKDCKSELMTTMSLTEKANMLAKTIRVMSLDVAFAHKLAAWNERRLLRDIYDCYFIFHIQNKTPDLKVLKDRLKKVDSRLPRLKHIKKMTLQELWEELEKEIEKITQKKLEHDLKMLLPEENLFNLEGRIKTSLHQLIQKMRLLVNKK